MTLLLNKKTFACTKARKGRPVLTKWWVTLSLTPDRFCCCYAVECDGDRPVRTSAIAEIHSDCILAIDCFKHSAHWRPAMTTIDTLDQRRVCLMRVDYRSVRRNYAGVYFRGDRS